MRVADWLALGRRESDGNQMLASDAARRPLRTVAVGLVLAALVAGCGSGKSSSGSSSTAASPTTPSSTTPPPARGELANLTWDLPSGEPFSIDPVTGVSNNQFMVATNLCEGLYTLDPHTLKLAPDLATSFSRPNPTTLVYGIRRGVKFWDGHPLTAADVVYSLDRNGLPIAGGLAFWGPVKTVRATGPYQVTITLSRPDELLPREIVNPNFDVQEAAYIKQKGKQYGSPQGGLMCSGPFKLVKWTPGNDIVMVRNTDYWNKALIPRVHTVTFKFVSTTSSVTAGLLSGAIDGAADIPATAIPALQHATSGHLYTAPGGEGYGIINYGGLLRNANVRRALSLVIDRPAIVKTIFHGAGQAMTAYAPPWTFGYARSIFQAGFNALPGVTPDVKAAKALFAAAGSPKTPITIGLASGDQTQQELATVVQQEARQIGMNIVLRTLSPTQYTSLYASASAHKGLAGVIIPSFYVAPDPIEEDGFFFQHNPIYATTDQAGGYNNSKVNADLAAALANYDPVASARLQVAAQAQYIGKDAALIQILSYDYISFVNNRVGGWHSQFDYCYPWAAYIGSS
jgi:peptide/nickel transport system substrate-binding protein